MTTTNRGMARMKLALIHHTSTIPPPPLWDDLSLFISLLQRAPNVEYSILAWDDPGVDWTLFTHFFITPFIEYVPHFEEFLLWLDHLESSVDNLATRMFNPPAVMRWSSSKKYLKELEAKGIRIPPTIWLETEGDVQAWDTINSIGLTGDVVVKNVVDEGGVSAWLCNLASGSLPPWAHEKLRNQLVFSAKRGGTIVQKFLKEVKTEGEWSLVYFSGMLSHVVQKIPKREDDTQEFRVHEDYGGRVVPVPRSDVPTAIVSFGEEVMASVPSADALLFARVDLVRANSIPYLMELEVMDPALYMTEPEHAAMLFQAMCKKAA